MAIPARKDFGVATEPPKKEKEKVEKKEKPQGEISKLSPDHWFTGKISNILILLFAVFLVVKTLSTILGIDIEKETYTLIVAGATAVLYAVRWYQKQTTIEPVAKIAKVIIVVGLICLFIKPVWKVFSDSDKSLNITTIPGQKGSSKESLNITTIAKGIKARMNKPPEEKKQKSWKTVFEKEYVGVGFTGGDDTKCNDGTIFTATNGKDYKFGDKIIIKGNYSEVWLGNWYNIKNVEFQYINKSNNTGSRLPVRNKKGKKFKVTIKRFM